MPISNSCKSSEVLALRLLVSRPVPVLPTPMEIERLPTVVLVEMMAMPDLGRRDLLAAQLLGVPATTIVVMTTALLRLQGLRLVPAADDAQGGEGGEWAEGGAGLVDLSAEEEEEPCGGAPVPEVMLFFDVAAGEHHDGVGNAQGGEEVVYE